MRLALHSLAYPVTALGPGRRVVVWVAGCGLRCPGCITPQLWSRQSGRLVPVDRLADYMSRLAHPLDGVTVSGGEPFEQAEALGTLL